MKKIGIVLQKAKNNTVIIFTKVLKKKTKQKIYFFKIKKILVNSYSFHLTIGDIVEIKKTRPLSKKKNFKITKVLKTSAI